MNQTDDDINYDELDPNIRNTVRWLRSHGFNTTDSGDGKSKLKTGEFDDNDLINIPHVAMTADPAVLIMEANRLSDIVEDLNIATTEVGSEDDNLVQIQASYDPLNEVGLIVIFNIHDELLASKIPQA